MPPRSHRTTGIAKHRAQALWLRRFGYWAASIALVPTLLPQISAFSALCVAYLGCAPLLYERLLPATRFQASVWTVLETLILTALVLRLPIATAAGAAIMLTLVLCQLAEGGWRRLLLVVFTATLSSLLIGFAYSALQGRPVLVLASSLASSLAQISFTVLVSSLLLLFMALAFTHIGYERSQRLYQAKQLLRQQSQQLQRVNQRLARYLPPELPARVAHAPEQPLTLQRRWLTLLFIDLCDFAACTRSLEAEALAVVLNDYLMMLDEQCKACAGSLCKVLGDGALIVFETTALRTERQAALRAIHLCQALPAAMVGLHERWRAQGLSVRLRYRVGVASGHCSIGDWGRDRLDYTVIGDRVNLAARLQAKAEPGTALLDDATALLTADRVPLTLAEPMSLKGMGTIVPHVLVGTELVDHARRSAMVPSVSVALEGSLPPGQAASVRQYEREQPVSSGLPR